MTRTLTALAAALALSACATAPDAPSRGVDQPALAKPSRSPSDRPTDIPTRATARGLNTLMEQVKNTIWPACVQFDGGWGYAQDVAAIAQQINMRGLCVELVPGGTAISAGVMLARQSNNFRVADPDAKVFGVHLSAVHSHNTAAAITWMFGPEGYDSPGCLDSYLAGPWYDNANQLLWLSKNELDRGCK